MTIPQPTKNGTFTFNGTEYQTLHEAIRAMHTARNAEPVTMVTVEPKWFKADGTPVYGKVKKNRS